MEDKKFCSQQCQNEEITKSFRQLHNEVVDLIVKWCHDNNVMIDEFNLNADCLEDSIKAGSWQSCTDSALTFMKFDNDYKRIFHQCDREFIRTLTKNDINEIEQRNHEPYLFSM